jgi:outer membrane protein assembly factor BamB
MQTGIAVHDTDQKHGSVVNGDFNRRRSHKGNPMNAITRTNLVAALVILSLTLPVWSGEPVAGATGQRGEEVGWPCWRGPLGGGVVPDPGRKLVRDLSKAKLVWPSEDQLPFPYENNLGKKQGWFGGFGSPVVEDGRIFVGYVRPYGRDRFEFASNDVKRLHMPKPGEGLVRGENVIHCFDARTGKTLWRFASEEKMFWVPEGHYTCCVNSGIVCMFGAFAQFYGVDTATGKLVWSNCPNDKYKDAYEKSKAKGDYLYYGDTFYSTPSAVDGVVAIAIGADVHGFDIKTGKPMWKVKTAGAHKVVIPVLWNYQGTTYFVASNTCIEPRTGKVLWQIPGIWGTTTPCVSGEYYVCTGLRGDNNKLATGSTCFRITPKGYEKLWSLDPGRIPDLYQSDVICGPYFLQESTAFKSLDAVELATGKMVGTLKGWRQIGYAPLSCQGMVFGGMYRPTHWELGKDGLRLIWEDNRAKTMTMSEGTSAAIVGTRYYYRTFDRLVCLELAAE